MSFESIDEPGRTPIVPTAENAQSPRDESDILADTDQTDVRNSLAEDEHMGTSERVARSLETNEEPLDFVHGDLDVSEQIRRTTSAMERARGARNQEEGPDDLELNEIEADRPDRRGNATVERGR